MRLALRSAPSPSRQRARRKSAIAKAKILESYNFKERIRVKSEKERMIEAMKTIRLYQEGKSMLEIAIELNRSKSWVSETLRRHGVQVRKKVSGAVSVRALGSTLLIQPSSALAERLWRISAEHKGMTLEKWINEHLITMALKEVGMTREDFETYVKEREGEG